MTSKGNFKVRVVQNIGEWSKEKFGVMGSILEVNEGIMVGADGFAWDRRDGSGYSDITELNERFREDDQYKTVFELVEEPTEEPKVFKKGVKYRFSKKKFTEWHLMVHGGPYKGDKDWVEDLSESDVFAGNGCTNTMVRGWLVVRPWCKKVKEKKISIDKYQKKSLRTLNTEGKSQEQIISGLLLGIHGESGEISDIFKKHYNQGHELDINHVIEEIGDTMFYIVNLCNVLGIDMSEVLEKNVAKLLERYPHGFEEERSTNRYNRLD